MRVVSRAPRPATRALCCLLAATVPLQGCAWLFQSRQAVLVTCAIPGATLLVDGKSMAVGKLALETGQDHEVQCVAEGYAPKTIKISGRTDIAVNWLVCDILLILAYGVGIPFLIVDFATGSIWDLDPRRLIFNLDPLEPEPEAPPTELARAERPVVPPERRPAPPPAPEPAPPLAERVEPPPPPPAPAKPPPPQVTKRPPPRPTAEPPGNPLAQGGTPATTTTEAAPARPDPTVTATPPPVTPAPAAPTAAIEARPASATEPAPVAAPAPRRRVHVLTVGVDAPADSRLQGDPRRARLASKVAGLPGAASASSLLGAQATRAATLAAITEREGALGQSDVLVVVVAAPACVDPDDTAWLLLADADPTALEDTALEVDVLVSGLERSGAGTTIVAVYAAPAGEGRALDAAALGPGIVRVVARDSKGAEGIASALETTLEDLAGSGVVTDVDQDGAVTSQDLAAYLKGRAIACEVAPP